jgi:hypothetical protein
MSQLGANQMNQRISPLVRVFASVCASLAVAFSTMAADIERPQVQFVDKFGVNMGNGQVSHSLSTVSIGGAMGLSHSVSVFANEFNYPGMRGFADKFYARAQNVRLCSSGCNPLNVMRVHDWSDTANFAYYVGGVLQPEGNATSGYTYAAVSDERHTLEAAGSEFIWTKPDGTVVRFNRGGSGLAASVGGVLTSVEYPNGFTIWVKQGSVNTNTGFQLKYYFTASNPPHSKSEPPNLQAPIVSPTWPLLNPQYVRGINAWRVYCSWTTAPCSAAGSNDWPNATFEWPAGMPRTMYIGESTVKVTDSAKRVTSYKFLAYDLAYDEFGTVVPGYTPQREFSPRLREVTPPGASAVKLTYDYKNLFTANMFRLDYRLQSAGVVKSAIRLGVSNGYTINQQYMSSDTQNAAGSHGGVTLVHQQNYYGNPTAAYYVDTIDGRLYFEENGRNFPRRFEKTAAPVEQYFYETRSNLTKVNYNDPAGTGNQVIAEYPATCSNRKTCNQATRIRDAKGNWTDYEYFSDSGLVKKITYPANKDGIRPETRFTYALYRATYFNESGVKVQAAVDDGIYLKTTEEYCINSSPSGDNCTGSDEVVTSYEYNHPNLLMTGMVVTAPGPSGPLVRRTCYRYDDFGNQIGVTTPNANLGSCPGVMP